MIKRILLFLLVIGLLAGGYGYYLYQKPVSGLEQIEADYQLTADELYDEFDANEAAAMKKFEDKVVSVTGNVIQVDQTEDGQTIILGAENAMIGGVNCSMKEPSASIEKGQTVTIKGRCHGMLMDVVINNCYVQN